MYFNTWGDIAISNRDVFEAASLDVNTLFNLLVKRGANLNAADSVTKKTALMLAIQANNSVAFSRLINQGASVSGKDREGWTPFLLACREGQTTMAENILARLQIEERNAKGKGHYMSIPVRFNI